MEVIINKSEDNKMFLLSAFALSLICTIQAEEKQYSARWNRTRAAEESVLRVCDMYVPDGINSLKLDRIWDIIDGPVMDVFRSHASDITVQFLR